MPTNDSELLALGSELDRISNEWLAQMARDRSDDAAHNTKVRTLTGINTDDLPRPYDRDDPQWLVYDAVPRAKPKPWDDIHSRLFPLCEHILSQRAHTLAGLAVQANAVSLAAAELWDPGCHHDDDPPQHERMFIQAVCDFLGIIPVPARLTTR
jgi:hypothetical protein